MRLLTPQILNSFQFNEVTDQKTIQRGKTIFLDEGVWDVQIEKGYIAACQVDDKDEEYSVTIFLIQASGDLKFECDCSLSRVHFCSHMVAATLETSRYISETSLEEEEDDIPTFNNLLQKSSRPSATPNWQNTLDTVLKLVPPQPNTSTNIQRYAAVILLLDEGYYYPGSFRIMPYVVKTKNWSPLHELINQDMKKINDLMETNHDWLPFSEEMNPQANPAGCINLSAEATHFMLYILQIARYYGSLVNIIPYFPILAQLQIPIFINRQSNKKQITSIHIDPELSDLQVSFTREQDMLVLKAGISSNGFTPMDENSKLISTNPAWALIKDKLVRLRNPGVMSSLSAFPIAIPESQANFFRQTYLKRIAEILSIQSDLIQWRNIFTQPTPRLYLLEEKENKLLAQLRFSYEDYELDATKTEMTSIENTPDSWEMIRIQRQQEPEQKYYEILTDPAYFLKRAGNDYPYGTFELRARAHPFDFLAHAIPKLAQAGFEIFGENNLKLGKINRSTPTLRVNISSGIDWFDLKTIVEYGDQLISLHAVRKALKRGEHYIKLADGSVGQIPQDWLDKYKHLWSLAHETEEGFRVSDFHLPLIDSLLEDDLSIQPPEDFSKRREQFRNFEKINNQNIPQGFIGELRPYQKHGFEWMHFLREYNFGGILADDMGLGKTIQVLVYLLSLKERGYTGSAVLLVVPKSLITNWQRESEKFTPGLRFLEYIGNIRVKNTNIFDNYDVVITTYGIMLRDIEILNQYNFHYVILDESQSIKNPLAKSARAARLLKAEHRLVMTGTPVENNTFELWSQFAFLNPGLLGNMDYFKREFSTPIENSHDEQAIATLRKLIYPFILRRTKEQVAPELPLRTERVLYTDMDAPQKKLYNQTRDHYRAELLGLIENQGINDARFKILEGLLRLRQIAIHPALVDKSYKGDAPKFDILMETLETLQVENHKALIFSQFVEILNLVRIELEERNIKYVYLDGQTPNRQSRVDLFQNNSSYPFFLISLKAGGVGLNLTAADYVIHLDPWWNPAVEMQASDRAHRIGQDKPVFVYKIITRDSVEEKILQLQEHKRALVKNLISAETSFFKSLTQDDVKMLFE